MNDGELPISAELLEIVNTVLRNKGQNPYRSLACSMRLREDIGFDSLDLAELTARIDYSFHLDVFKDGVLTRIGEVQELIERIRE